MGKLEFGVRQGLAVDMQWDQRINDLRYQQQQKQQAELAGKAQAKMYADDFAYKQPMNNFDNPRVKQYAQNQIKAIGKYVNENPDWETNIAKRGVYSQMLNDLKNGDDYRRGVQSDTNWEAAQKDMSDVKNADLDFTPVKQQWENYQKYGNQFGEEAAKKDGPKQFVYSSPQSDIDVVQDALKTGQMLGTTDKFGGPGFGAKTTFVEDKKIRDTAIGKFEGPNRSSYENAWKKLSDEQRSFYSNDKFKWAEELVRAGTDVKKDAGQYIYPSKEKGGAGAGNPEAYSLYSTLDEIPRNKTTAINQEYIKTISPVVKDVNGKGTFASSDVLRYKVADGKGGYVYRTLSSFKGQTLPGYETGNYMNDYSGRAMIEVMTTVPMTPELTNAQNGLFTDDAIWGENYVPRPGMENQVKPVKTDEGWFAQIPVWVPAQKNKYNGQQFDNVALGQSMSNKSNDERSGLENKAKMDAMVRSYQAQGYDAFIDNQTGRLVFKKGDKIITP